MTYFTAIFNMKNIYLCRGRIPVGFVLFKSMDMLGFEITLMEDYKALEAELLRRGWME